MKINTDIYSVVEKKELPDLNGAGYLLYHKKSGVKVVLISNDDENKVFTAAFRTPPENSKGTPHIIEHSLLSGSDKYPMKDPYLELVKGSLHTFLNAMTYADRTLYPVASCNQQDFKNLMDVYMDAVFCPAIRYRKEIFLQEGWRYEYDKEREKLQIQGIVYNEMKGTLTSPTKQLLMQSKRSLFPDTAYAYTSGGEPEEIPKLSYEEFLEFYEQYYHPSNCYLYLYGDMDFEERLAYLDREYLSHYEKKEVHSELSVQPSFHKMVGEIGEYAVAKNTDCESGCYFSYSVVLPPVHDAMTYMSMRVLDYVLLSMSSAVLYQAFVKNGIGEDCWGDFLFSQKQPSYSIVCMNARMEQKEDFLQIIKETLRDVVKQGIDKELLYAAIHRLEFSYREADTGSDPKGLEYAEDVLKKLLYDEEDIFELLSMEPVFAELKERVKGRYFEELIEKVFLNNDHCSMDMLTPKPGLQEEQESRLAKKLEETLHHMNKDKLIAENDNFKEYQERKDTPEILAKLPVLQREDLIEKQEKFKNEELVFEEIKVIYHELPTNGIGYLTVGFDMSDLPDDLYEYAGLMVDLIGQMDGKQHTYQQMSTLIGRNCGGIWETISIYDGSARNEQLHVLIEAEAKMLYDELPFVFDMMQEQLFDTDFSDEKRMKELLQQIRGNQKENVKGNADSVALNEAKRQFSKAAEIRSRIGGLEYLQFLNQLCDGMELCEIAKKMEELKRILFTKERIIVSYTGARSSLKMLEEQLIEFGKHLYASSQVMEPDENEKERIRSTAIATATAVQYVAVCGELEKEVQQYRGVLDVAAHVLYCDYLWQNVRAKGGAYGCFAAFPFGAYASFVSYRDPHLKNTLAVYQQIPKYLAEFTADERQMMQYIVGTYNKFAQPEYSKDKGKRYFSYYMCGETEESKQKEKLQIIHTTKEDMNKLSEYMERMLNNSYRVIVADEKKINDNKELFDIVKKIG